MKPGQSNRGRVGACRALRQFTYRNSACQRLDVETGAQLAFFCFPSLDEPIVKLSRNGSYSPSSGGQMKHFPLRFKSSNPVRSLTGHIELFSTPLQALLIPRVKLRSEALANH